MSTEKLSTDDLQAFKNRLFDQLGILGGALSSPKRLEIIDILCQGSRTVEELAQHTGLTVSNVSQHLRVLKNARMLESDKRGLHVHYSIADPQVAVFWASFRSLALSRLAEVREVIRLHLDQQDELEPVDHDQLRDRLARGEIVLLDVRPEPEYLAGHIPGAVSAPLERLAETAGRLNAQKEIVAYCRGPYCVLALQAVKALREQGFNARRFEEGIPEWRAHGLPVETRQPALP